MNVLGQQLDGAILAARYAFMPNKLRYCGGEKNTELFSYAVVGRSDDGLKEMLKEFATMYPYLRLIAEANRIFDPFNRRVVEAYWVGNDLLERVSMKDFYRYLVDEHLLKKKFKPKLLELVWGKLPAGAKPHHSWHVLNIPKRAGEEPGQQSLETMDNCRISWGKIREWSKEGIKIDYQPLIIINDKLTLGEVGEKKLPPLLGEEMIVRPQIGDWVSLHWGWICDVLSEEQKDNLEKWTRYNLNLLNLC